MNQDEKSVSLTDHNNYENYEINFTSKSKGNQSCLDAPLSNLDRVGVIGHHQTGVPVAQFFKDI